MIIFIIDQSANNYGFGLWMYQGVKAWTDFPRSTGGFIHTLLRVCVGLVFHACAFLDPHSTLLFQWVADGDLCISLKTNYVGNGGFP